MAGRGRAEDGAGEMIEAASFRGDDKCGGGVDRERGREEVMRNGLGCAGRGEADWSEEGGNRGSAMAQAEGNCSSNS